MPARKVTVPPPVKMEQWTETQTATAEVVPVQKTDQTSPTLWSRERLDLLKLTIAKGLDDVEFALFVEVCKRRQLDPFARQIFAVKRWDNKAGKEVMSIQTSIDGFRLIAERSGKYQGQTTPYWCGQDGVWKDIWTSSTPPFAAKIGVYKQGLVEPTWGIAYWETFKAPGPFWQKAGPHMIAKCAEALALRKAFPEELSGLYTGDELESDVPTVSVVPLAAEEKQPVAIFLKSDGVQTWQTADGTPMTLIKDLADTEWLFSGFVNEIDQALTNQTPLMVYYTVEMGRRIVTSLHQ